VVCLCVVCVCVSRVCGGCVCVLGVWLCGVCVRVCVRYDGLGQLVVPYTHAHHSFKITLPNTDQAHDKHQ